MKKNVRVITSKVVNKQFCNQFINEVSTADFNVLTDSQYSKNSLLAQTKDWNLFTEFCRSKHVSPLPASSTAVRLYLERESRHRKYATIKRYAVTIGLVHRILDFPDPTSQAKVRETLASLRLNKHNDLKTTVPFERAHLILLKNKLETSQTIKSIRNLAIYYLMFECMLKRSELRQLTLGRDITLQHGRYVVSLGGNQYSLSDDGEKFLRRWISVRGDFDGTLFNAIDKHNNLSSSALDDSSIYRIMRSASDLLNLDVQFSGLSLRVGAARELAHQGVKTKDIQKYGRWLSAAMPYQHIGHRVKAANERMIFKTFKPWD